MLTALVSCYREEPAFIDENRNNAPLTRARGFLERDAYSKNITDNDRFKISSNKAVRIALEYVSVFEEDVPQSQNRMSAASSPTTLPKTIYSVSSLTDDNATARMAYSLDAAEQRPDTLVHIVNFANEDGYAFISTDERDGALLAYSGKGNFNINDTVGNKILAFHVDMILNYVKVKKVQKYETEAQGLDYFGDMEITELDENQPAIMSTSMPGSGLPGGGQGMPGYYYTSAKLPNKEWKGNENTIELVKNRFSHFRFPDPVPPPQIEFQQGPPGLLGPDTECVSTPYCYPPVFSYETYYSDYGCYLHTWKAYNNDVNNPVEKIGPYTKTAWDQKKPLNLYCNGYGYDVGCAALALLQIFNYFGKPVSYQNNVASYTITLPTYLPLPATMVYNEDMILNGHPLPSVVDFAAKFVRQIGKDLGMVYTTEGSGPPGLAANMNCVRDALLKYGYKYDYIDQNYMYEENFGKIKKSLEEGKLIFIYGFRRGWTGILSYFDGHCWIIDGYMRTYRGTYNEEFRIDEWGNYNSTKTYSAGVFQEYVSSNYGDGSLSSGQWVLRGVYDAWDGDDYAGRLRFMSGIEPVNK